MSGIKKRLLLTRALFLLTMIFVVIISCQGDQKQSEIIARVRNHTLTVEEVKADLPKHPGLNISEVQVENYIKRWIEKELVYQEALKNRYDKLPYIQKKLDDIKRDYIVASYLEQLVNKNVKVDSMDLMEYYEEKKTEFIRKNDYYQVSLIMVSSYQGANILRRSIINGLDFNQAAEESSIDPSSQEGGYLGWLLLEDISSTLARRIPQLRLNSVSRPIKTEIGYALVKVTGVRKKDEPQTLEEAKEKIRWRIETQKRELLYRQLISVLGDEYAIDTHWELVSDVFPDSAEIKTLNRD
jgi:parvulin-like peptidyl-prolyl isomerase